MRLFFYGVVNRNSHVNSAVGAGFYIQFIPFCRFKLNGLRCCTHIAFICTGNGAFQIRIFTVDVKKRCIVYTVAFAVTVEGDDP